MFQSFSTRSDPQAGPARLAQLREEMARQGLSCFLIPRSDTHQGEYVAARDERLGWLTGFTGSAGFCAVLPNEAAVFTDARYRVQVKDQIDLRHFTPVHWPQTGLGDWLAARLADGAKVGFDPWLHGCQDIRSLREALSGTGISLQSVENPVDRIWHDQPEPPVGPITPYPDELAGESHESKRKRLSETMKKAGQSAAALTLPDSIAWLLNIRGGDIPHTPVAHAFAILHDDSSVELFVAEQKLNAELRRHLGDAVSIHAPPRFEPRLSELRGNILVDKASVPVQVVRILEETATPVYGADPCILPKARKNPAEIAGAVEAHLRDGAAMAEFLCWLDHALPGATLTEIDVVRKLEEFRRATGALRDISFDTICGAGPNGAIVHYRVTEAGNRTILPGELLLIDSGGQYPDGTTDITRTVAVGEVGDEEKTCFTRVLQGMVALSRARWPKGLAGRDLDALARAPLWLAGQDYDHGTGHGVGAYLSVHEGPARLSRTSHVPLEPGMILSNEPGYYREGAFGIRIENLVVVEPAPDRADGDRREMYRFRTLTHVPVDRRLITDMLALAERDWLNAYHSRTLEQLRGRVGKDCRNWLEAACSPL